MHPLVRYLDPRGSLAASIGWLVLALSIGLVGVASLWVGDLVRNDLLELRGRQLERAAGRIASDVNLNFALRLQSVRALAAMLATEVRDRNPAALRKMLENVRKAYPEFEWIVVADPHGRVLAASSGADESASVADRSWFSRGLRGSSVGEVRLAPIVPVPAGDPAGSSSGSYVECMASIIDLQGNTIGVIGAKLGSQWLLDLAASLGEDLGREGGADALLLGLDDNVLVGPPVLKGKRWEGARETHVMAQSSTAPGAARRSVEQGPGIERLGDGTRYLVAGATPVASDALHALGWRVLAVQPLEEARRPGVLLQRQIAATLLGLGILAAALGVVLATRLTRSLDAIAGSADAVRTGTAQDISVPAGRNEPARLGRALRELLASLRREREALRTLNAELDQRVAARSREIERLAEQERYAAVVRERLKIARDLHDTLAHSMMAMLAEIRLLKRIFAANPQALGEELARAEEAAHDGLREARAAIARMRFNPVRDAGLAAALADFAAVFSERTGIEVAFTGDASAAAFADERAETLFRITEEAMRNVERHSGATHVTVSVREMSGGHGLVLTVSDDGVGFDTGASHPGHYGLAGLREQAKLIGADLAIRSAPGEGTTITVALPSEQTP
jgi:signal transduction histidine kinase